MLKFRFSFFSHFFPRPQCEFIGYLLRTQESAPISDWLTPKECPNQQHCSAFFIGFQPKHFRFKKIQLPKPKILTLLEFLCSENTSKSLPRRGYCERVQNNLRCVRWSRPCVRPSVRPSVRPCVRSKMSPKIFMKMVPLSGETYFSGSQNGPKSYTFG